MPYLNPDDLNDLTRQIILYTQLKTEHGAAGIPETLSAGREALEACLAQLKSLPKDAELAMQEPDDLATIRALRPPGPRRLWPAFDADIYHDKLAGALLGRMAGCTLGAPVEMWPIEKMRALAEENRQPFPPTDYWRRVPEPQALRYGVSPRQAYTRGGMAGVPVDDDITYTLLGLLIAEDHGPDFATEDVGRAWLAYLPYACTAEEVALANLKNGIPALQAAIQDNPYREWIGASIRADPWGYMAPGWPERAAEMAYQDAYLSHRRQGIYGEMFFAAAIAAAFHTDDPVEALRIGLTEIPHQSTLAQAVRWALEISPRIQNFQEARDAVDARFEGMSRVHTVNNACLTVWGITLGGTDFSRVIGETVAMGLDNDCTAATAGSLVGTVVGQAGVSDHWHAHFNDTIHTYLIGRESFSIRDVLDRFEAQARRVCSEA
jgi:ADP-ribosylglycohydrolase